MGSGIGLTYINGKSHITNPEGWWGA